MSYTSIRYEKRDHVVTITLDRPHVHNCIDRQTCAELQGAGAFVGKGTPGWEHHGL